MSVAAAPSAPEGIRIRLLLGLPCVLIAALSARSGDWHPIWFFIGLAAAAVASDLFVVVVNRVLSLSAALVPIVIAGIFLGPVPAAVIGAISSLFDGIRRSSATPHWLGNTLSYAAIGLGTGLVGRLLDIRSNTGLEILAATAVTYALASAMSLLLGTWNISPGWSDETFKRHALSTVPAEALLAGVAGVAGLLYRDGEYGALFSLVGVALLFNYFAKSLVHTRRYADEMRALAARESRLTARLAEAQSIARRELADALHAGPVQTLLSVRQDLAETDVARARDGVAASLQELRDLMVDLHVPLTPGNARASLDGLGRALEQRYGITIELDIELTEEVPTDSRQMRLAFDAAQELTRNAAKHAHATIVRCSMRVEDEAFVVRVTDDGIGLDEARLAQAVATGHVGLAALRARVHDDGGRVTTVPRVPSGTMATVQVPLRG